MSARIGVKALLGGAGAILMQANLSGRIGVKLVLGGAGVVVKQPNLSARIGVKSFLGPWEEATKPVSQDWDKVVVVR